MFYSCMILILSFLLNLETLWKIDQFYDFILLVCFFYWTWKLFEKLINFVMILYYLYASFYRRKMRVIITYNFGFSIQVLIRSATNYSNIILTYLGRCLYQMLCFGLMVGCFLYRVFFILKIQGWIFLMREGMTWYKKRMNIEIQILV
jgi:hypothetical protein